MKLENGGARGLTFALPDDLAAIMGKVEEIEAILGNAGCDPGPVQQIVLVAEEILTNIRQNAWGDGPAGQCRVEITAEARPDGVLVTLRTHDDGVAFDPLAAAAPDLDAPLEEREIGGLGIHLIRVMTDSQAYQRVEGVNVLEVSKLCTRTGA